MCCVRDLKVEATHTQTKPRFRLGSYEQRQRDTIVIAALERFCCVHDSELSLSLLAHGRRKLRCRTQGHDCSCRHRSVGTLREINFEARSLLNSVLQEATALCRLDAVEVEPWTLPATKFLRSARLTQ